MSVLHQPAFWYGIITGVTFTLTLLVGAFGYIHCSIQPHHALQLVWKRREARAFWTLPPRAPAPRQGLLAASYQALQDTIKATLERMRQSEALIPNLHPWRPPEHQNCRCVVAKPRTQSHPFEVHFTMDRNGLIQGAKG